MKSNILAITSAITCAFAIGNSDAKANEFGNSGTFSPGGVLELSRSEESESGNANTDLVVGPQLFYFVLDDLAIGLSVTYARSTGQLIDYSTRVGIAPAIGYNVEITESVSLFPNASFGVSSGRSEMSYRGLMDLDSSVETVIDDVVYSADIVLPMLVHVGNFHLGFGPYLRISKTHSDGTSYTRTRDPSFPFWSDTYASSFENDQKDLVVGVRSMIGGWF